MLDIKRDIYEKIKYVFDSKSSDDISDKELNETILLHVVDNLPYIRDTGSYGRKALCEFCESKHG